MPRKSNNTQPIATSRRLQPARPLIQGLSLLLCLCFSLANSTAQAGPTAQPVAIRMSDTPLRVESIGLTLYLPEGASARTDLIGSTTATRITPPGDIGHMAVQSRHTTNLKLTPRQVGDGIIKGLSGKLLERVKNFTVSGMPADRFYIQLRPQPSKPTPIQGYTVVQPRPGLIVIFELATTGNQINHARTVYETTVGTAQFVDASKLAAQRTAQLRAGTELIARLTPDDYRAVIEAQGERWQRLSTPALTGAEIDAEEHGYRRIQARIGYRGELDPQRPRERWSKQDKQPGYILQIDALLLEPDMRVDSQAIYFMSTDRAHEAWTVRMALRRDGRDTSRWTEIGVRDQSSMIVRIDPDKGSSTTIRPLIQGEGYITQFESLMMGPLLVHAGVPADFAFYAYSSGASTITLRTDSIKRVAGTTGPWKITTRTGETAPTSAAYYAPEGDLIALEQPNARVWKPTQLKRLLALWEDKGLPID